MVLNSVFSRREPFCAAVLGSTGSVGLQALDVLSALDCRIVCLAASQNAEMLAEQARRFHPLICTLESEEAAASLRLLLAGENVRVYGGADAVCRAIEECGADLIVHAIAGLSGLPAAITAAGTGARLGMANKEAIIAAGDLVAAELCRSGGELIPVDSEHSAIFQCLAASNAASPQMNGDASLVRRILLTASGGPFFGWTKEKLCTVTPAQALAHPTWKMGRKITVDSATLMNKGFEVIEAMRLFHVPLERIEVLVHRQSIIHSMVEYIDNTVIAQLAAPDMRDCIRYAASYPSRIRVDAPGLDFARMGALTFAAPDTEAFPLLDCARRAAAAGGIMPTALIAADEEAVAAFLGEEISFCQIASAVEETLARMQNAAPSCLSDYYDAEREARACAHNVLAAMKN